MMREKRMYQRFFILFILYFFVNLAYAQRVSVVVLDAGHGGHDSGALGKNSREKDITLSLVLKLRDYIQQNMKDVKVVLTRDDDSFVELHRRAKIANENKADLFISIHCNSVKSSAIFGVETFVMGLHKSDANLAVAKAENAAILLEDDYVEKYDGFDPNSAEGNIFFSMMQNAFLDKSLGFAGKVQHQMVDNLKMHNRGVKQAGFLVLYKTAMPGVLIETGFISNPKEEKFLLSDRGQEQMVIAIYNALLEYKDPTSKKIIALVSSETALAEKTEVEDLKKEASISDAIPIPVPETENVVDSQAVSFRIQFAMYPDKKPVSSSLFKDMEKVMMYVHGGAYKYTSGYFTSIESALQFRKNIVAKGYKDAFVVAFKGEQRISIDEARKLTEKK